MTVNLTKPPILRGNQSAPSVNPRIQEALTKIGGFVPSIGGKYAGMPVYRLAWGQSEKHFDQGRERIRFIDLKTLPIITQERFFVAPEVYTRVAEWLEAKQRMLRDRFLSFDFNVFAHNIPLSSYLKENEAFWDYQQLPDAVGTRQEIEMDYLGLASHSSPENWMFLADVKDVEIIGKPFWYVMKWISAEKHGGRESWEKTRYAMNAYVPELNDVLPIVDRFGAFPEYGFWIPFIEVADYVQPDGSISYEKARTAEPTEENCINPVLEREYEMRQVNLSKLGIEQRNRDLEEELLQDQIRIEDSFEDKLYEKFEVKKPNKEIIC
jgi:hypothetical protein